MCLYLKIEPIIVRGIVQEADDWGIKLCMPSFDFKGVNLDVFRVIVSKMSRDCLC